MPSKVMILEDTICLVQWYFTEFSIFKFQILSCVSRCRVRLCSHTILPPPLIVHSFGICKDSDLGNVSLMLTLWTSTQLKVFPVASFFFVCFVSTVLLGADWWSDRRFPVGTKLPPSSHRDGRQVIVLGTQMSLLATKWLPAISHKNLQTPLCLFHQLALPAPGSVSPQL